MPNRRGRKSASQTPAPLKDRIVGSKINPAGSASSEETAKGISLSPSVKNTLRKKLQEFKKKYPKTDNVSFEDLKAVYRRGAGAYSKTHRPTISGGAPNTRSAWGIARVNKFLEKAAGEPVKKAYVQDDDLLIMEQGGKVVELSRGAKKIEFVRSNPAQTYKSFSSWVKDNNNISSYDFSISKSTNSKYVKITDKAGNIFSVRISDHTPAIWSGSEKKDVPAIQFVGYEDGTVDLDIDTSIEGYKANDLIKIIETAPVLWNKIRNSTEIKDDIRSDYESLYSSKIKFLKEIEQKYNLKDEYGLGFLCLMEVVEDEILTSKSYKDFVEQKKLSKENKLEKLRSIIPDEFEASNGVKIITNKNESRQPDLKFTWTYLYDHLGLTGKSNKRVRNEYIGQAASELTDLINERKKEIGYGIEDMKYAEGGEMENFDWESLFKPRTKEQLDAIANEEKERKFNEARFSKKWASNYDEALEKLTQDYKKAKIERDKWSSKQYKSAGDKTVSVGNKDLEDFERGNVRIDYINEKRKHDNIKYYQSLMDEAILDMKRLELTDKEIDSIVNKYEKGGELEKSDIRYAGGGIVGFNKKIKDEYLNTWKDEYETVERINEMVARYYLYELGMKYYGSVEEIQWVNESKKPKNHFQMRMYLGEVTLDTSPFIYVDDNHRVVKSKTKVEVINTESWETIKSNLVLEIGGKLKTPKSILEIAREKNVSIEYAIEQLRIGIEVEKEHTNDHKTAETIALHHLDEDIEYYKKLKKMEKFDNGGAVKGKNFISKDGKHGGIFDGKSHAQGGIPAINVETNQKIEVEGNEVIINKRSVADETLHEFDGKKMTNREILSEINQSGGGVAFAEGGEIDSHHSLKNHLFPQKVEVKAVETENEAVVEIKDEQHKIFLIKASEMNHPSHLPILEIGTTIYSVQSNGSTEEWNVEYFTENGLLLQHAPKHKLHGHFESKMISFDELEQMFREGQVHIKNINNERELGLVLEIIKEKIKSIDKYKDGGLVFVENEAEDKEMMEHQFGNKNI